MKFKAPADESGYVALLFVHILQVNREGTSGSVSRLSTIVIAEPPTLGVDLDYP